jgi:hypothetical protein
VPIVLSVLHDLATPLDVVVRSEGTVTVKPTTSKSVDTREFGVLSSFFVSMF